MLDGTVKPGRPEAQVGAHVANRNVGALGVVYVGGVATDGKTAKDTRTPAQRAALLAHVKALIARYPMIRSVLELVGECGPQAEGPGLCGPPDHLVHGDRKLARP
jgi:hypothetical protein